MPCSKQVLKIYKETDINNMVYVLHKSQSFLIVHFTAPEAVTLPQVYTMKGSKKKLRVACRNVLSS